MSTQSQNVASTTQLFLDIHDITNNLVIMKDGTTSVIITVDAMNFGLLAEEEQDGIIYAYAGLLNSLNYPIQIVIRSQTKDVTQYLTLLKEQEDLAPNRLMQHRIRTYREFVSNLIQERNVLDKKFYVVIPASAIELGLLAPSTVLPGSKPLDLHTVERSMLLEKAKSILEPKKDHLIAQFARIGLLARELETQEIIQLFYMSYNPEAAEGQEITDSNSYTTPLVKAGMQNGALNEVAAAVAQSPLPDQQTLPQSAPIQPNQPNPNPPQEIPPQQLTASAAAAQPAPPTPVVAPAISTPVAPETPIPITQVGDTQTTSVPPVVPITQVSAVAPVTPTVPVVPLSPSTPEKAPVAANIAPQAASLQQPPTTRIEQEIYSTGAHTAAPQLPPTQLSQPTTPYNQAAPQTQLSAQPPTTTLEPSPSPVNNTIVPENLPEIQLGGPPSLTPNLDNITPPLLSNPENTPLPPVAEIT
jgi:hypothetical protein